MIFVYSYTDHPLVRDQPELSTHYNQSSADFLFLCEGKVSAENASQSFVVWSVDGKRVQMSAVNATDDRKFTAEISYRDLVNFTYGSKVGFDIWQVFEGLDSYSFVFSLQESSFYIINYILFTFYCDLSQSSINCPRYIHVVKMHAFFP